MNKTLKLTVITDATLDIETTAGADHLALIDLEAIERGSRFRINARTPIAGYFYVVILDNQTSVVDVAYPESTTRQVTEGERVVAPAEDAWLVADASGPVRVVIANQPVAPSEWPRLGHGRDGDAHMPVGNQGIITNATGTASTTPAVPPPSPNAKAPPANPPKQPSASK
jgi:hypothetical protein